MKININGKQATVEMSVEHLMGILELVAQQSCRYIEVAIYKSPYFWDFWKCNELVEDIADAIDINKLDKIDKSFVDEIKKEMRWRNGRE